MRLLLPRVPCRRCLIVLSACVSLALPCRRRRKTERTSFGRWGRRPRGSPRRGGKCAASAHFPPHAVPLRFGSRRGRWRWEGTRERHDAGSVVIRMVHRKVRAERDAGPTWPQAAHAGSSTQALRTASRNVLQRALRTTRFSPALARTPCPAPRAERVMDAVFSASRTTTSYASAIRAASLRSERSPC